MCRVYYWEPYIQNSFPKRRAAAVQRGYANVKVKEFSFHHNSAMPQVSCSPFINQSSELSRARNREINIRQGWVWPKFKRVVSSVSYQNKIKMRFYLHWATLSQQDISSWPGFLAVSSLFTITFLDFGHFKFYFLTWWRILINRTLVEQADHK